MNNPKDIATEQMDQVFVATPGKVYETLDGPLVKEAESRLLELVNRPECSALLIDMSNVRFFGSAFIESLIRVWNVLKVKPGSALLFCEMQPYCQEVLTITHLDHLWKIRPTREAALETLHSTKA